MKLNKFVRFASACDAVGDADHTRAANIIDIALQEISEKQAGNPGVSALNKIAFFANLLDFEGYGKTANILDQLLKEAQGELWPSANDRDEKYDAKANNAKTLYRALSDQPLEDNEPVIETLQGKADSLLTRHSPDYPGVPLLRVSDGVYQDIMTRKIYDFNKGFVSDTGIVYPGGSTAHQTPTSDQYLGFQQVFESKSLRTRPRTAAGVFKIVKKLAGGGDSRPFQMSPEEFEDAHLASQLLDDFLDAVNPNPGFTEGTTDEENSRRKMYVDLMNRHGPLGAAREVLKQLNHPIDQIEQENPGVLDIFDGYLAELYNR